jgi:hypothetical protein
MMFEQLVRPFQSRPVTTTRRIVPVVTEAVPETAVISWGKAGTVPVGVRQPDGVDLENIETTGFRLRDCSQKWKQTSRLGEDVDIPIKTPAGTEIGKVTADRTKEITFGRRETAETQPFSYAAVGVAQVIAGLRRDIPGSNSCDAEYTLVYD